MRTLRMAIQMMRQVRIAVGKGQLAARLDAAVVAIKREVVDAKRQFESGQGRRFRRQKRSPAWRAVTAPRSVARG
ncbi:MAG: hypothetical protein IPK26_13095 [Planctomycetes bacterium]|nr:hypothetical protein [Planctomycetota bacterium]